MKTKFIYKIYGIVAALLLSVTACTDYLDKAPDSVISPDDAYKNFTNFQGFVERMYHLTPDIAKHNWVSSFNWGEDEVVTIGNGEYLMGFSIDRGNYRDYIGKGDCFLDRNWSAGGDRFNKSLWGGSWYGIRVANMGLEALAEGKMTDATQAERDMIEGQLYFFRAWFHFQLTQYWGGLPYVDKVLPSDEPLTLPRESYQENALKMAADFQKAADLLPINWDDTEIGRRTANNNELRINKIWALSMLGKTYLYASSPLMANGINGPRTYDTELAKKAADAFGKVLSMVENGETQYALVDFEDYSSLFYTIQQGWLMPGGSEAIIRSPTYGADSFWRQMNSYQPSPMAQGDGIVLAPAANYVNYFGMANGLPLDDPESGFDPTHPWKGRDPRFYNNFIYDGVKVVSGTITNEEDEVWRYANLHTGGNYVNDPRTVSRTGYLNYKFIPLGANIWDNTYGYSYATHFHLSWLRLADVYLMYAEAAAQGYGSPSGKSSNFSKNAIDALNTVRERAGVEPISNKYTSSLNSFMDELIRERAVELSFEGHRFNDLRRWLLLTEYPYNIKTRQHFDRAAPLDTEVDPKENEVRNFREEVIVERNLTNKHYWLPFNTDDVSIYPEFYQNPGW
ncbi:MAG TPA: RagB/SusD family nutrient uptake outer membrane protein [Fermentimonas sp.]|nr:RagB/SusD family nutrient uptake outer membrane protein [Fermentimonas sp.]MDD4697870.1 RagB/SusD family nutrient uptake outer membrane protein [Fermentimonas sp.]HLW10849.1 RagB/SusD family nutrient uptake outer membrane protein [Fermentimonas sp.]